MGLMAGVVCGLTGVFVVLWRMSLLGICISHAAFAGALIGLWLGWPPLAGGLLASLAAASALGPLTERPNLSLDTAIGLVFAVMLSLAIMALGLLPGAKSEGLSLMWGSLLSASRPDLILLALNAGALITFVILFFKEIQAIIGQRRAALAAGIPVRPIYYGCLILMGLSMAVCLKAVGGLLIYALVVTPAATAMQLSYSLRKVFLLSAVFGAGASIIGLWLSLQLGWPSGAAIVLTSAAGLVLALIFSPKKAFLN